MLKKRILSTLLALLMLLLLLPAVNAAKAETVISGFTLAYSGELSKPSVGDELSFSTDRFSVTSTEPAGLASKLEFFIYWYDHTSHTNYTPTDTGVHFTPGKWTMYLFVEVKSSDYVIDYDNGRFDNNGDLETIELGGRSFRSSSLCPSYIGYSTEFYIGVTPDTIDLTYNEASFPYASDRMTFGEASYYFRSAITSPKGDSVPWNASDGWYVATDEGFTAFCEDYGDPTATGEGTDLLVGGETYWICFNVAIDNAVCEWNADQEFTINGSAAGVHTSKYGTSGNERWLVARQMKCKTSLYDSASLLKLEPKNYTGAPQTQERLEVWCHGRKLTKNTDYTANYSNNVEPGYADIEIVGIGDYCDNASGYFYIFPADSPHEVVNEIRATSNISELLVYGGDIQSPTFTVTTGLPVHFEVHMGGWSKRIGDEWERISSGRFGAGEWRFSCQIRIDGDAGSTYTMAYDPDVYVDGAQWKCTPYTVVMPTYCYNYAGSPTFTVAPGSELIFNKLSTYDIGPNYINQAIPSYSVAGTVEGGTAPYVFSKTSGPAWVSVSPAGQISGTPTKTGSNENLIVRVTDQNGEYAEITIQVGKTAKTIEDKTKISKIVATSDFADMAVAGNTVQMPTFTVTEGAPAYFHPPMGGWYRKNGDTWQYVNNGETFTEGVYKFFCQLRIDEGGEEYVIPDAPTVIVNDVYWNRDNSTVKGFDFCYLYVWSPEFTVSGPYTVEWDPADVQFRGTTPYVVLQDPPMMPRVIVKDEHGVVDPSLYAVTYYENMQAGTGYADVIIKASGKVLPRLWFKIYLPATDYTKVENRKDGIYIAWHAVPGAAGYVIYRRAWNASATGWTSFVRWNNTTELHWTDTQTYAGTRYQYGIKAYFTQRVDPISGATIGGNVGDNYNLGEVGPLKTTVRITTRTLNTVTGGTKQITAKWGASKNFTGYQVQIATDAGFTQNRKTVTISDYTKAQYTFKDLKAKTTYYVRVRSYHIFDGTMYYGQWSNVKNAKTK